MKLYGTCGSLPLCNPNCCWGCIWLVTPNLQNSLEAVDFAEDGITTAKNKFSKHQINFLSGPERHWIVLFLLLASVLMPTQRLENKFVQFRTWRLTCCIWKQKVLKAFETYQVIVFRILDESNTNSESTKSIESGIETNQTHARHEWIKILRHWIWSISWSLEELSRLINHHHDFIKQRKWIHCFHGIIKWKRRLYGFHQLHSLRLRQVFFVVRAKTSNMAKTCGA